MVERGLLREVGGFRSVRKFVDAQLLAAMRPRRRRRSTAPTASATCCAATPSGHTWQVDLDYLLDPVRVAEIRPGFAPSRLLEYDESERPVGG